MAYTKTTWAAGDTVTSQKLNKIENQLETLSNGGGAGCFVVNITEDASSNPPKSTDTKLASGAVYVTDKTYDEIVTAFQSGSLPIGVSHTEYNGGGTRGASTGTSEEWEHLVFAYAAFDADYGNYEVIFTSMTNGNSITFYATDPDSILTSDSSGGSGSVVK